MQVRSFSLITMLALVVAIASGCSGGSSDNNSATSDQGGASGGTTTSGAQSSDANGAGGASMSPNATPGNAMAGSATIPNCGTNRAVWVNTRTKVMHPPGDPMYGRTKHGVYLCPDQATMQGYHYARHGGPGGAGAMQTNASPAANPT